MGPRIPRVLLRERERNRERVCEVSKGRRSYNCGCTTRFKCVVVVLLPRPHIPHIVCCVVPWCASCGQTKLFILLIGSREIHENFTGDGRPREKWKTLRLAIAAAAVAVRREIMKVMPPRRPQRPQQMPAQQRPRIPSSSNSPPPRLSCPLRLSLPCNISSSSSRGGPWMS